MTVTLTSPADIVAAVPHLCGFVPAESLVAVSLRRKRIGLTLRVDLPPDEAADEIASRLAHDRADAAVVVVYTSGADGRIALVEGLRAALELRGMRVVEALLVRDGLWTSYLCTHPDCCPPEGTPVGPPPALLAASAAYDGRAVLRDRDELVASLQPSASAADALDGARTRWLGDVRLRGLLVMQRRAADAFRAALHEPPADVSSLVVALQDKRVRDEVATLALDDAEALLSLLLAMAKESTAPYDVPVCTLVALVAWVRGDGALANVALDRALDGDPRYGMALLLRAGLDGQLPPKEVRLWLRETRRALAAA
jgi:hypothetical protein